MAQISLVTSTLYQFKAKSRSEPLVKESETVSLKNLNGKLADLDERLKFSPFLAGSKLTFIDILLFVAVNQLTSDFPQLEIEKTKKKLTHVSRMLNYVKEIM